MNITDIDKNFSVKIPNNKDNFRWFDVKEPPFQIYGLLKPEKGKYFSRMPEDVAVTVNDGVAELANNTSGGKIRFSTIQNILPF